MFFIYSKFTAVTVLSPFLFIVIYTCKFINVAICHYVALFPICGTEYSEFLCCARGMIYSTAYGSNFHDGKVHCHFPVIKCQKTARTRRTLLSYLCVHDLSTVPECLTAVLQVVRNVSWHGSTFLQHSIVLLEGGRDLTVHLGLQF